MAPPPEPSSYFDLCFRIQLVVGGVLALLYLLALLDVLFHYCKLGISCELDASFGDTALVRMEGGGACSSVLGFLCCSNRGMRLYSFKIGAIAEIDRDSKGTDAAHAGDFAVVYSASEVVDGRRRVVERSTKRWRRGGSSLQLRAERKRYVERSRRAGVEYEATIYIFTRREEAEDVAAHVTAEMGAESDADPEATRGPHDRAMTHGRVVRLRQSFAELEALTSQWRLLMELRSRMMLSPSGRYTRDAGTQVAPRDFFVRHEELSGFREDSRAAALASTRQFATAGAMAPRALWGFSHESGTQTEWKLLGRPRMRDAETGTSDDGGAARGEGVALLQYKPMLVDARTSDAVDATIVTRGAQLSADDAAPLVARGRYENYTTFREYVGLGSIFAGPWRCEHSRFYGGAYCQVEFDDEDFGWEPLRALLPPWSEHSSYTLVPLCALWINFGTAAAETRPAPAARQKMSRDDGGGVVAAGPIGTGVHCYVASASDDGRVLTLTRAYGHSHGGHGGKAWTLHRTDPAPKREHRHALRSARFAGRWRCESKELFGGDVIVIEPHGDPCGWRVEGKHAPASATYHKIDLLDLTETRTLWTDRTLGDGDDIERIFRRYDVDQSQSIDTAELRGALAALGLPVNSRQAAKVLAQFDTDRSGRLEYGEVRRAAGCQATRTHAHLPRAERQEEGSAHRPLRLRARVAHASTPIAYLILASRDRWARTTLGSALARSHARTHMLPLCCSRSGSSAGSRSSCARSRGGATTTATTTTAATTWHAPSASSMRMRAAGWTCASCTRRSTPSGCRPTATKQPRFSRASTATIRACWRSVSSAASCWS